MARALAGKPKIIFADEPTGNLDSRAGTEILRFMRQAVIDLEQTIVMVTHDPVAASYANRVLFLSDGQIVEPAVRAHVGPDHRPHEVPRGLELMRRVTLRSLWEHKRRLLSTVLAVVLGVSFMSGTFIMSTTIDQSFDDLFTQVVEDVDVVVQGKLLFSDLLTGDQRANLPPGLVEEVAGGARRGRRRPPRHLPGLGQLQPRAWARTASRSVAGGASPSSRTGSTTARSTPSTSTTGRARSETTRWCSTSRPPKRAT